MSKDKFSIMKTAKRVMAIVTIIILSLAIGYLAYTGSRLASVQNEANKSTQSNVAKEANSTQLSGANVVSNATKSVVNETNRTQKSVANEAHNAPRSVVKEVANE